MALSLAVTRRTTRPTTRSRDGSQNISARSRTWHKNSEPVEASVKWFNADKGFGFVTVAGGSDAFLPSRALEAAGHSSVPDGARLKVRISQGPKGPQVAEVLEVDTSTAQVMSRAEQSPSPRPFSQRPGAGPTEECLGSVKWYNAEKGFGFVAPDTGGRDVFLHATTLRRGGLNELAEGQRVRMQISLVRGRKGRRPDQLSSWTDPAICGACCS